jgi:hypothetical protein
MIKLYMLFAIVSAVLVNDPFGSVTQEEKAVLKPQIERWVRDQLRHDWADLWEIQDQTSDLKNELLSGRRDASDMDRSQYVKAMRETIGIGYPEIKAFALTDVRRENGGFSILGCGKLQRESWKQTSITYVHVTIVKDKATFGLPGATPQPCKL